MCIIQLLDGKNLGPISGWLALLWRPEKLFFPRSSSDPVEIIIESIYLGRAVLAKTMTSMITSTAARFLSKYRLTWYLMGEKIQFHSSQLCNMLDNNHNNQNKSYILWTIAARAVFILWKLGLIRPVITPLPFLIYALRVDYNKYENISSMFVSYLFW